MREGGRMVEDIKDKESELPMQVVSICPGCFQEGEIKTIPALLIEKSNQIWIVKNCPKHGRFEDIVFRDAQLWRKWMRYQSIGRAPKGPILLGYPGGEELYEKHRSWPLLVNLLVTNRCNLRCWYCFMNAGRAGYVYDPPLEVLKEMMLAAKEAGGIAIQITGGEPTVREDILEILKFAREHFTHVQLNTNGIRLAEEIEFCKKLKGLINTIYISFDGVTEKTNPWIEYSKKAIENLRKAGVRSVVLVPTVHSQNLEEMGKVVRYAIENRDVVRGVIFQPIAMAGSIRQINEKFLREQRVDYVDLFEVLEKEFNKEITRWDFYPVPFVDPIRKLIEKIRSKEYPQFSPNPMCGGATYVFWDREQKKAVPITRFIDVERFMEFVSNNLLKKQGVLVNLKIGFLLLTNLKKFIIKENLPKGLENLGSIIAKALIKGDYSSLGEFHYNTILIGSMWFQDPWNIQLKPRVERCVIQYITEEGLMSFCLYNGLGFGEELRKKYGMAIKEWEEETGKKLIDDIWEKARKNPVLLTGKSK